MSTDAITDRLNRQSGVQLVTNLNSSVATYFVCGGTYRMSFVYNLLLIATVKKFESRSGFHKVIPISLVAHFFGTRV